MEDYNKIIESLGVRYIKAKNIRILQPLTIENFYDVENTIILVNKGGMSFNDHTEQVSESQLLFVPGGKYVALTYGTGNAISMTNDDFISVKDKYLEPYHSDDGAQGHATGESPALKRGFGVAGSSGVHRRSFRALVLFHIALAVANRDTQPGTVQNH